MQTITVLSRLYEAMKGIYYTHYISTKQIRKRGSKQEKIDTIMQYI